jgi:hypothetical protein
MKTLIALVSALSMWSGAASAQLSHSHGAAMKGPNGGPMQDIVGVHAELVVAGTTVTVNLLDEANKPVSAKGFSGQALVVSGGTRETVVLAVSGDSGLQGEAKSPLAAGATVTLVLRNAAGRTGQVKF